MPIIFASISILMVGSTAYTEENGFIINRDLIVQSGVYIVGYIAIFIMLRVDYAQLKKYPWVFYAASIALMLLVYTPLGVTQYGSRAWINVGITLAQPCEFVKITFTLWFAAYLDKHYEDIQHFVGLLKAAALTLPVLGLVALEDLGNALVFMFIVFIMIFAAGVNLKLFLKCTAAIIACVPVAYFLMKPHQRQRIDAFLNPDDRSLPGNYQVWNSKIAIGSGGLSGKGLFNGTQKSLEYLPVAKSDFIFAVIGEEFGFIGCTVVLAIYTIFVYRIIRIAKKAKEKFGTLVATGFGAMFFFQIFENAGMTMGIMPVTGITLPFISYGGTSVLANMMILGIVLCIGSRSKVIFFK